MATRDCGDGLLSVYLYLSSCSRSLVSFGAALDACLDFRLAFISLSFSFVGRLSNSIAHAIVTDPSLHCNEGSSLPLGFD